MSKTRQSRSRPKVHQFLLDVDNKEEADDASRIQKRFELFNTSYNKRRKSSSDPHIDSFLYMCSTSDDIAHKVFIQFGADLSGVHRQHFQ